MLPVLARAAGGVLLLREPLPLAEVGDKMPVRSSSASKMRLQRTNADVYASDDN